MLCTMVLDSVGGSEMTLILASASPRRRELLTQLGLNFMVVTSDFEEDNSLEMPPTELVLRQAREKSLAVAAKVDANDVVIGADTVVVVDNEVYGKPRDTNDAIRMLASLSGREHCVITGVAVARNGQVWTDRAVTRVRMAKLSDDKIKRYVATGEPMDKAGAYAIQGIGSILVEEIAGCYFNVVGLPLRILSELLHKAGIDLL